MPTIDPYDPMDDAAETWRVIDQEKVPWLTREWRRGDTRIDREIEAYLAKVETLRREASARMEPFDAQIVADHARAFMEKAIALATGRDEPS